MSQIDYSTLPVSHRAEIVVCGGGTAGAFAAIAAAEAGRDVLLIEQFGMVGGSATAGLVTPVMHSHIDGDPSCSYLSERLRKRLLEMRACDESGRAFDPLMLKVALEQMCAEAGVRLLYHTFIPDAIASSGRVTGVVIANKDGLSRVEGEIFIDCTGDGDVCVRAGADFSKGNPDTGVNQPMSLRYIVGGVDTLALGGFFDEVKRRTGVDIAASVSPDGLEVYAHCCKGKPVTLTPVFEQAVADGDLIEEDHLYWQAFSLPGRPGCIAFNCPEFFEHIDGTSVRDLTLAQINGKRAILRQMAFYRKCMKGFEHAWVAEIAAMVGVRESREIVTEHVLTEEELYLKRKHPDMFCQSNYPIDVHGRVLSNAYLGEAADDGRPWYEIPFRCLLVKGFENLMTAGRCIGASFAAQASVRVQQSARSSGEAAGIGAAMALQRGVLPRQIDGAEVRARMIALGARYAD
ncbi:MAG: FAD-dependent oxidoreductase [Candidatus Faecivicinus sp.]